MRRSIAWVCAFALGCGVILGAAVAYYLLPEPEGDLSGALPQTTFPVTLVDFVDQRSLALQPKFSRGIELVAATAGIVTSSSCDPGQQFVSGSAAFSINGAPVIALAAEVPFYRDLEWGDEGADVNSLRGALVALGYNVEGSGFFSDDVYDALSDLQDSHHLQHQDGKFHLTDFMWMPTENVLIKECNIEVGQTYASRATIATTASALESLSVVSDEARQVVAGERRLHIFGVDVTVPLSGAITDPTVLAQIATSPDASGKLKISSDEGLGLVSGTSELIEPLRVAAIPAVALYNFVGANACVAGTESVHKVALVGSNLGMSLVSFAEGVPPQAVSLEPEKEPCDVS